MVKFSLLETICGGQIVRLAHNEEITSLFIDSRKSIASKGALFIALAGERHDAHQFFPELYASGFRQFIIERPVAYSVYPEANFIRVKSSLSALQDLATYHRKQFSIPVIGITGSNGKTIVKEWLYQLMSMDYNIVKNPGSYNSQVGVPVSIWQLQTYHELGIFEAGISKPGEMEQLERMIRPSIGIFTNVGPAHDEGFENGVQKIREKLQLFSESKVIIYNKDQVEVAREIERARKPNQQLLSWGVEAGATMRIRKESHSAVNVAWNNVEFNLDLPFTDLASVENASHCVATMLYMGFSPERIRERVTQLKSVPMRLELKQGINQCQVIDDTYNNDLAGLQISLDFLTGLQKRKSTIILSDILQSGLSDESLVENIAALVIRSGANSFIGIGPILTLQQKKFERIPDARFFISTEEFLRQVRWDSFQHEAILVKGARLFRFERIIHQLQRKIHGTVMEIDLGAIVHNLNFFRAKLKPAVKLMVMVKALAYGSGSEEVAHLLQYHHVDYLGVAYPDEGVELRNNQVRLPILVMNPSEESFETLIKHALEPEIYSLSLLRALATFLSGKPCKIHFKIDTGMHRLGFEESQLSEGIQVLKRNPNIEVVSVFSHLAGADDEQHDDFTKEQGNRFLALASHLKKELKIDPILHILNSAGILRFPELQLDMVRLGIGLYGVDPTNTKGHQLQLASTLKTVISQIKTVKERESIGYGRKGRAERETTIATLAIGYADGFSRRFSEGVGQVWIKGKLAPVIGNVCMDMTMVDVTGLGVKEGDEVIIFGKELPIDQVAARINTIPYEILTSTSERVQRVFYAESI